MTNLHVTIERVYVRIEAPDIPFAFGFLIPYLGVGNANQIWEPIDVAEDPTYMYKPICLKNFTIFMERDSTKSSIDSYLKASDN